MNAKKDLTNLSKSILSKSGANMGSKLHGVLSSGDSVEREYQKYKMQFRNSLTGTQRMLYDSISGTEQELYDPNLNIYRKLIIRANLYKERNSLRAGLSEAQKAMFTKVNRLAANLLREKELYTKAGRSTSNLLGKKAIKGLTK